MTQKRATKRRSKLQKNIPEVAALLASGSTNTEVAEMFGVASSSVTRFAQRFADEIEEIGKQLREETVDLAIANVRNRIEDAQLRRNLMRAVQEARARGESGVETGIVATTYKQRGVVQMEDGEESLPYYVPEYKVDTAFLKEWRENEDHVAKQLGQTGAAAEEAAHYVVFADKQINLFDRAQAQALMHALMAEDEDAV